MCIRDSGGTGMQSQILGILKMAYDKNNNQVYFIASKDNPTERYLYSCSVTGIGKVKKITPEILDGVHSYSISTNAKYALHSFSNYYTRPMRAVISLPKHNYVNPEEDIVKKFDPEMKMHHPMEFFKVTTVDDTTIEGWIVKPKDMVAKKKYPVLFYFYSEPAGQTGLNRYGAGINSIYDGNLSDDGYVGIGEADPDYILDIYQTDTPTIRLNDGDQYQAYMSLAGNDLEIRGSGGRTEIYNGSNDGMSSTKVMVIENNQRVGIGTELTNNSLTNNKLHVLDATGVWQDEIKAEAAVLRLETNAGTRAAGKFGSGIVFNGLGGHSTAHGNNIHAWIGLKYYDLSLIHI